MIKTKNNFLENHIHDCIELYLRKKNRVKIYSNHIMIKRLNPILTFVLPDICNDDICLCRVLESVCLINHTTIVHKIHVTL